MAKLDKCSAFRLCLNLNSLKLDGYRYRWIYIILIVTTNQKNYQKYTQKRERKEPKQNSKRNPANQMQRNQEEGTENDKTTKKRLTKCQ